MNIIIDDPELIAKLTQSNEPVTISTSDGILLGRFESSGRLPKGVKSPFSDEEINRLCQMPKTGRSLQEILSDLEKRG